MPKGKFLVPWEERMDKAQEAKNKNKQKKQYAELESKQEAHCEPDEVNSRYFAGQSSGAPGYKKN